MNRFIFLKALAITGLLIVIVVGGVVVTLQIFQVQADSPQSTTGLLRQLNPFTSKTECPDPLLTMSPVDTTQATAILYPGQYRGRDYKPHGGFGFANNVDNKVEVRLPMDARLVTASRYLEMDEVQYLLEFRNDCGVGYRFDHLLTLTPEFQALVDKIPEPKQDDSRTTPIKTDVFPVGTVVATRIGHPAMQNVGMDFGVYDFRQTNQISKHSQWAMLHEDFWEYDAHAVCWFGLLPENDRANVKKLEAQYGVDYPIERAVSDYCQAPGGTTLDYNSGQPTDEVQF